MKRLELYSAAVGTVIFVALFLFSCIAQEFTMRDSIILSLIASGFGIAWFRLRKSN